MLQWHRTFTKSKAYDFQRSMLQGLDEGWFAMMEDVPKQADQIMQCKKIISYVPCPVKAEAAANTVKAKEVTNMIPAARLKTHPGCILYMDEDSAAGILSKKEGKK